MSVCFEAFDLNHTSLTIAGAGTEFGEDVVPEGEVALVLSGDEVAYVQGDPDMLRRRLHTLLAALEPYCSPS